MLLRRVMPLALVAAGGLGLTGCATGPQTQGLSESGRYSCGQLDIQLAEAEDSDLVGLEYLDRRVLLKPAPADSGNLYAAPGDADTWFRAQGERGTLSLQGEALPECLEPGAVETRFSASGADPSWSARIDGRELDLEPPYKQEPLHGVRLTETASSRHGRTYEAEIGQQHLSLTTAPQLCEVGLDAVQYPAQVHLEFNGEVFQGCGGSRERLFRGAEWVVEDLAGSGIIDRSRITVEFLEENRLAGRASCNRYGGAYQLTPEGVNFDRLFSTMMACAPALMNQERRFLELMSHVNQATIGRNGELVLTTSAGEEITAFPSTHSKRSNGVDNNENF